MKREEKRGEETMNICNTELLQNCLLHRTTELYARVEELPRKIVLHLQKQNKLQHWCGITAKNVQNAAPVLEFQF